jgi:hypothetical protein
MSKLYIDENINLWHPELIEELPNIRDKYKEHKHILHILDEFETTFLFSGA